MSDCMTFPKTADDFIEQYSFKDSKQEYTNGAELIPVFRVKQMLEQYALMDVVRCRECKHYDGQECFHPRAEMGDALGIDPTDFCSYGERKDND